MHNLVDLHVHSTASDGTLTPKEVVRHAYEKGLKAIALTDHDTLEGIEEGLLEAEKINLDPSRSHEIEVVPGIEISCNYKGTELHILGYFIDGSSVSLKKELISIRQKRVERNERMLALFKEQGFAISMEELNGGDANAVVTRAHFARVLLEKGYVKSKNQAFDKYLSPGCPLYLKKPEVTPEHAMEMLKNGKAVAVLAHPLLYHLGDRKTEECIKYLKTLGLCGVEAYHSSNCTYDSGKLKEMAVRNGLIVTGGSDFHGENKPDIEIGCGRGKLRVHESLLEQVRMCKKLFS